MNWLRRMMYGRYGSDQLNLFLLILAIALSFILQLANVPGLSFLSMIPLIYAIYRMFSRNINARQNENMKFLGFWRKVKNWFVGIGKRIKDVRHYKYFACPSCKQTVRVPRGKGKISIKCPKCGERFTRKS